jgi:tetratricopeptide (TPR) repeat protein
MSNIKSNETRQIRNWVGLRQFEQARKLERSGEYEQARQALSGIWNRVGERPAIDRLTPDLQAEGLLRVGTLTGWIGSAQQIAGAQEIAKDLITEALRRFGELADSEKTAEAQTDLALCYWRLGSFDEARVLFQQAESNARTPENKLRVMVNSSAVEISCGQLDQAAAQLDAAASFSNEVTDGGAVGRYYLQRALLHKKRGGETNLDLALIDYSAASFHLSEAGDVRYVAAVENNIAMVLLELGRTSDALTHFDTARSIFVTLKESGRVAEVNEARAQALIAQQSYAEAERAAFAAVSTLERGDEHSLLTAALITHAVALARLGNETIARAAFDRAAAVAENSGDLRQAGCAYLSIIEELSRSLVPGEVGKLFLEADERFGTEVDSATLERLRSCARIVAGKSEAVATESIDDILIGGPLEEELRHVEAVLIKRALNQSNGSITRAARSLGLSHQGLNWKINNTHTQLLAARTPRQPRRKSIIKKK